MMELFRQVWNQR